MASTGPTEDIGMDERHATETVGAGWLISPIKNPPSGMVTTNSHSCRRYRP